MISLLLAAALSQTPAPAPVAAVAPTPAAATAPAPAVAVEGKDSEKTAGNDERTGCVARTGSRIRRHDKANCDNGRSISAEDIERAGGQIAPYAAPVVPAASGN